MTSWGLAALAAVLCAPATAAAANITVSTTADEFAANSAACSLREAIWAADNDSAAQAPGCAAGSGLDTIEVPAGTYNLTRAGANENAGVTGDLDVTTPVAIRHDGKGSAVIDAKGLDRVFHVTAIGGVTLANLVIQGGSTTATGTSGAGILNSGALTVSGSTIANNVSGLHGGGIETIGSTATLGLTNSTVYKNTAAVDGGGIDVSGAHATLLNATIDGNGADADRNGSGSGGGIGVFNGSIGQATIAGFASSNNTIVAANVDGSGETPDCFAQVGSVLLSLGQTLIGNPAGCTLTPGSGDVVGQGPRLAPLADQGGPTPTQMLLRRSPAINRGANCPLTDQRGVPRGLGGACDIGAYELVRCKGRPANLVGTNDADVLNGTEKADVFLLLGGDDTAFGLGGNDVFCGGAGRDRELGGADNDHAYGDTGRDRLIGGPGNDRLSGGGGVDRLLGGGGRDRLLGGGSDDLCNGGSGSSDRAGGCEDIKKIP
jgi:CSLREA domain-containing protein